MKSREALALLTENHSDVEIIEYLKETPDANELKSIIDKLGIPAAKLIRTKEEIFKTAAEEANLQYQSQRLDLVLNIKNSWYDLYLVDKSLEIYHEYYDLLKDFVDAAAVKYATGEGIQAAVLKAQVEHASIQARIKELNRRRSNLQSALNRLRNQQGNIAPLTAIDSSGFAVNLQDAQAQALADRPEVAAIQSRKQRIGLEYELAGKDYWPDYTLQATYISVEDKNSMAADAGKDAWSLMVGLNIPLWQAPRNAERERTIAAQNAEEARLQDLKIQIRENINDLIFRQASTHETIVLYKNELLPQAENSLASALAAYRAGRIGFLELLDAERMLLQLRLSFINEQVNYQKTVAALERAVGKRYE